MTDMEHKRVQNLEEERRIIENVRLRINASNDTFITLPVADLKALIGPCKVR